MKWRKAVLSVRTNGKGLYPITAMVTRQLKAWGAREGMCFLYIQHNSASLAINESYDPSARVDLEAFLERLAPEGQDWYRHTLEGEDDSPSHLRSLVTPVSLAIPIDDHALSLGTWQGIYLFEHRREAQVRSVLLRCLETGGEGDSQ